MASPRARCGGRPMAEPGTTPPWLQATTLASRRTFQVTEPRRLFSFTSKHAINHAGGLPGMYDDLVRFIAPRTQHTGSGLLLMAKYGDEFLDTQYLNGGDGQEFKLELIYYPLTTTDGSPQSLKLPQPDDV